MSACLRACPSSSAVMGRRRAARRLRPRPPRWRGRCLQACAHEPPAPPSVEYTECVLCDLYYIAQSKLLLSLRQLVVYYVTFYQLISTCNEKDFALNMCIQPIFLLFYLGLGIFYWKQNFTWKSFQNANAAFNNINFLLSCASLSC